MPQNLINALSSICKFLSIYSEKSFSSLGPYFQGWQDLLSEMMRDFMPLSVVFLSVWHSDLHYLGKSKS